MCIEVFSGGELPFPGMSDDEVYDKVMKAYYVNVNGSRADSASAPVLERPPDCPPEVWTAIIEPCLCILDSARPQFITILASIHALLNSLNDTHQRVRAHTLGDSSTIALHTVDPASVWALAQPPTSAQGLASTEHRGQSTPSVYEDGSVYKDGDGGLLNSSF
jgi:hypothetical protein